MYKNNRMLSNTNNCRILTNEDEVSKDPRSTIPTKITETSPEISE